MKNLYRIGLVVFVFSFVSCSTTMKNTWTKTGYTGKKFSNVLVVGATKNLESRTAFESTVVKMLGENGIVAKTSIDVFPPVKNVNELSEEKVIETIKNGMYDGLLVASLVDVSSKDVEDTENYAGTYIPGRYGYGRYIFTSYNMAYSPDYYREQKTYVLESRLFDTSANSKEEALLWTGQTNITDPTSYESLSKRFAKIVVSSLLDAQIIKQ